MPRSRSCSIQSIVAVPSSTDADLVGHTRIEQDALGRSGLAGVDVRHDADVARFCELCFACHSELPRLSPLSLNTTHCPFACPSKS